MTWKLILAGVEPTPEGPWAAATAHRLAQAEAGHLAGIVTMTDIVRAVADGRLGGAPSRDRSHRFARR